MMGAVSRFAQAAASRGSATAATTRAKPSATPARSSSPSTPPPPNAPAASPPPLLNAGGASGSADSAASKSPCTVSRRANASAHCAQSAWNAPEACPNASGAWSAASRYAAHPRATPSGSPRPAACPSQGAYAPTTRAAAATTSGCDANTALFGPGFEPRASPMRVSVCRRNASVPSRARVSAGVSRSRATLARVRTTSRFAALAAARAMNSALSACCQLAAFSSCAATNPR